MYFIISGQPEPLHQSQTFSKFSKILFLGIVSPPASGHTGRFIFDLTSIPFLGRPTTIMIHSPTPPGVVFQNWVVS